LRNIEIIIWPEFAGCNAKYKKQEHKKQHKYYKEVETRGFHLLITPSETNIMRVKERLASQPKGKKAKAKAKDGKAVIKLIEQVNPIVIG
jgi:hypothetical protein